MVSEQPIGSSSAAPRGYLQQRGPRRLNPRALLVCHVSGVLMPTAKPLLGELWTSSNSLISSTAVHAVARAGDPSASLAWIPPLMLPFQEESQRPPRARLPRCCSAAKEEPGRLGAGQPQLVPRATCLEVALDCAFEQTALRELACGP
jgi:hypothetical protein